MAVGIVIIGILVVVTVVVTVLAVVMAIITAIRATRKSNRAIPLAPANVKPDAVVNPAESPYHWPDVKN